MRVNILQMIWELLTEFVTGIMETVLGLILELSNLSPTVKGRGFFIS